MFARGIISTRLRDFDDLSKWRIRCAKVVDDFCFRSRMLRGRNYRDSRSLSRRITIIFVIGLIAFLTFIVFATRVGRRSSSSDPNFDPMLNPNIHVARDKVAVDHFDKKDFGGRDQLADPLENLRPVDTR